MACSRRDTIHLAAQKGIGALTFAFIDPEEAEHWIGDYYTTLENDAESGEPVRIGVHELTEPAGGTRDGQKAKARKMHKAGESFDTIGKTLGVSKGTAWNWCKE